MKPRLHAEFRKYTLEFIKPMGTSRGALQSRDTWVIGIGDQEGPLGLGECAPLPKLSPDDQPGFETKLGEVCATVEDGATEQDLALRKWPAIRFGVETALKDLQSGGSQVLFESEYTRSRTSIITNGLVVMGETHDMLRQAQAKVAAGFRCIKIKIGALDFDDECRMLQEFRQQFRPPEFELRLDANGAFNADEAMDKMRRLSEFCVHSIEQPVKSGQWPALARLCADGAIPVALDEELIGLTTTKERRQMLDAIKPQHIILKPTLLGGFKQASEWISLARQRGIGYWVTSALESNIGLNALAQWTATLAISGVQGLGTGRLFRKNFDSRVTLKNSELRFAHDLQAAPIHRLEQLELH